MHVEAQKLHEIRFIESSGEIDCFRVSENYCIAYLIYVYLYI